MNTTPIISDPLTADELLLLQHLDTFNAPFYKSDVYLTFLKVVPNLTEFNQLFSLFRLRGYIYSLSHPLPVGSMQEANSLEALFYQISVKGVQQLVANTIPLVAQ